MKKGYPTRDETQKVELEITVCPLCRANQYKPYYQVADYYTGLPGRFQFVQCMNCSLIYLNPRPNKTSISHYYPTHYAAHATSTISNQSWLKQRLIKYGFWKRCQPLLQRQKSGRVLDLGCGTGEFLAAMQQSDDWTGVGLDFNEDLIKRAKTTYRLEVYVGDLETEIINFSPHSFDAVTLWDVLEHTHHPRAVLENLHPILKPQGSLLLRVPRFDSLDRHLFGNYWAGLDAPRHLTVFSGQSLTRLLMETGYQVEKIWSLSGSHASFVISCRFLLSQYPSTPLRQLVQIMASPFGIGLSFPYFWTIDRLGLGPEMTVLAQKNEGK